MQATEPEQQEDLKEKPEETLFMEQNRAACHCSVQRSWVENPCQWKSLLHTSELVHMFNSEPMVQCFHQDSY